MIKLIIVFLSSIILLYNSLRIVDVINKREASEERINDSKLKRLVASTLTSFFVGCLLIKYNFSIVSIKYVLLILYLFICAYIDQHTQNVYSLLSLTFIIVFSLFFLYELSVGINIVNYTISFLGTIIITSILAFLKLLGWGDVEVFIVISLFLGSLGFTNFINIFLSFVLSGFGAIYYLIKSNKKIRYAALCPYILISTTIVLILV